MIRNFSWPREFEHAPARRIECSGEVRCRRWHRWKLAASLERNGDETASLEKRLTCFRWTASTQNRSTEDHKASASDFSFIFGEAFINIPQLARWIPWCATVYACIHRRVPIRLGQMNRRKFRATDGSLSPFLQSFFSPLHAYIHIHTHTHAREPNATLKSSIRPCVILVAFQNSFDTMRSIAATVYASVLRIQFPSNLPNVHVSSRRLDFAYLRRLRRVSSNHASMLHDLFDRPCAVTLQDVNVHLKYS